MQKMITEVDVSESSQFVSELDVRELTEHVRESVPTLANWTFIVKRLVRETTGYRYQG